MCTPVFERVPCVFVCGGDKDRLTLFTSSGWSGNFPSTWAQALGKDGIHTTCVQPYYINTGTVMANLLFPSLNQRVITVSFQECSMAVKQGFLWFCPFWIKNMLHKRCFCGKKEFCHNRLTLTLSVPAGCQIDWRRSVLEFLQSEHCWHNSTCIRLEHLQNALVGSYCTLAALFTHFSARLAWKIFGWVSNHQCSHFGWHIEH